MPVIPGHSCLVPAALAALPVGAVRAHLRCPAEGALVLAERLLVRAAPAEHAVCPLVDVIHLLVVADVAREGAATAGETQPAVALLVVFASAVVGQGLTDLDAQFPLVAFRVLQLPPCIQPLTFLSSNLAPVGDTLPKQLGTLHCKVELLEAIGTLSAPPVARADVADADLLSALPARGLNIAAEHLRGVTVHPQHMRDGGAAGVADVGGHAHGELLLADGALAAGSAGLHATALGGQVRGLPATATHHLEPQLPRQQRGQALQ
mmetsp:Transcript_130459/g.363493  ORF Transcript_130459/g.363493 Transcript_130459/m.363493 type:complete len:264 (-) Transcript_130459:51-842(-)